MKRNIKYIVVHCTATQPNARMEDIRRYWVEVRKWNPETPGYHRAIKASGEIIDLLDYNKNSNGVYGHNSESVNIAYIGGIDKTGKPKDTRTKAQEKALFNLIVELTEKYPGAEVLGHRDFPGVNKACPSFDVKRWLANYTPDLGL